MCTRIRFLGWAPGSRVPSQAPTIGGSAATIMGAGTITNRGISVNPNQSPNDNARCLFMVDLLIELQPKSARNQSVITLFRGLSPTIPLTVEFRLLVRTMQVQPESLYGILATTSLHPTLRNGGDLASLERRGARRATPRAAEMLANRVAFISSSACGRPVNLIARALGLRRIRLASGRHPGCGGPLPFAERRRNPGPLPQG